MNTTRGGKGEGAILPIALIAMLMVGAIGAGLLRLSAACSLETAKWVTDAQAFWTAEAGIETAKARAWKNKNVWRKSEAFPVTEDRSWTGSTARGHFQVTVSDVFGAPTPSYVIVSEGVSQGGARAAVELHITQKPAITAGVFGNRSLTMQPDVIVRSFKGANEYPPTISTHEATIGSNISVDLAPGVTVDGMILLGESTNGTPAACTQCPTTDLDQAYSGWIDPDPLGAIGGPLADEFLAAQTSNDNGAVPGIVDGNLTVGNGKSVTLPAGTYYLSSINVRNNATLATAGPVTIYLTGGMDTSPSSSISIGSTPAQFRLYSNSTAPIRLQPRTDFSGFVYAPFSLEVRIQPQGDFFGAVWGNTVRVQPGGTIWVDNDLLSYGAFSTYTLAGTQWRELGRSW